MGTNYRSGNKGTNWESMNDSQLQARYTHYNSLLASHTDEYWCDRFRNEKRELETYCQKNNINLV